MQTFDLFALAGMVIFALFTIGLLLRPTELRSQAWLLPATASGLFLAFTLYATLTEGLAALWTVHTLRFWGNQVWFDLLLALAIGWTFLLPEARKLGMRTTFWLVSLFATGSIGLLAMYARILYLKQNEQGSAELHA